MPAPRLQDDEDTKPEIEPKIEPEIRIGTKEVTTRVTTEIPNEPDVVPNGHKVTRVRWRNRRRMAWTSLIAMLVVSLTLLFAPIPDERLRILADPLTWFFFSMTSIIGAYMGFTTWASRK